MAALKDVQSNEGHPSVLVNNAGITRDNLLMRLKEEDWSAVFETNLTSVYRTSKAVLRGMAKARWGRIINISSVGGERALKTGVIYAASKAAIIQMTRVMAMEWGEKNIRVNAIGPWYFRTPLTEKLLSDQEYLDSILAVTPMKRVGELPEVATPAVFLASEASSYITGQTLFVDGGMSIHGFS